jgi:hypothetical protein
VTIPSSVKDTGDSVFYGCTNLATVTIAEGLGAIKSYAFSGCASLGSINIPATVTDIGDYAFQNCAALGTLTLTNNITSVRSTAFYGADSLRVYVPANSPKGSAARAVSNAHDYYLTGDNAFALRYDGTTCTLKTYTGTAATVTIPSHVDYLAYGAFQDNTTITNVTIPSSVKDTGDSVFYGCTNLATVTIAEGLEAIKSYAFSGCASLGSINIPDSVTSIGGYAFQNCAALGTLTLTNNITSVRSTAFYGINDLCLSVVCGSYAKGWAIDHGYTEVVDGVPDSGRRYLLVHVPEEIPAVAPTCTETGLTAGSRCSVCELILVEQETVPALGHKWALAPSTAATDTTDGVRGGTACSVCGAVQQEARKVSTQSILCVPAMLKTIGDEAFMGAAAQQITLPAGARSIGSKAFADCGNLLIAVIPASVNSIAGDAFDGSDVAVICPNGCYAADWCDDHHIPHNP